MNCQKCKDTGYINITKDGREYVKRCDCYQFDFWKHKTFDFSMPKNYIHKNESRDIHYVKDLIKKFLSNDSANLILYSGRNPGVGKTTLATDLKKAKSGYFIEFLELKTMFDDMMSFNQLTSSKAWQKHANLYNYKLIVIDDLTIKPNLLTERFLEAFKVFLNKFKGQLIITTNANGFDELNNLYGGDVVDRMKMGGWSWIKIEGVSRRGKHDKNNK